MAEEKAKKTIRLGYGEYYSLKVTDSSKNIINCVEITPVKLNSSQTIISD